MPDSGVSPAVRSQIPFHAPKTQDGDGPAAKMREHETKGSLNSGSSTRWTVMPRRVAARQGVIESCRPFLSSSKRSGSEARGSAMSFSSRLQLSSSAHSASAHATSQPVSSETLVCCLCSRLQKHVTLGEEKESSRRRRHLLLFYLLQPAEHDEQRRRTHRSATTPYP